MSRTAIIKIRGPFLVIWAVLVFAAVSSHAQSDSDKTSPSSGSAAQANADDIMPFLNQTIVWSRQLSVQQQLVNEPSDALFLNDCRQIADQVVHQAFDFARARAQALANQADQGASSQPGKPSQPQTAQSQPSRYQRLIDSLARADQKVKQSQKDVDDLHLQLAGATGKKRRTLLVAVDEADSELELFKARRDALRNMLQFATGTTANGLSSGGLLSQVEELARTVPAAANAKEPAEPHTQAANATTAAPQHKETPNGIFSLATDLVSLRQKLHALDASLHQADLLAQTAKDLRTPLIARIRELTQKGDELSGQPESQDPAVLAQQRNDLDALTAQFKLISASVLPLGKQNILLDVYKRTTTNWRNSVASQYQAELKGLAIRLLGLAFILGVVLGISELWRRATFRYITDARRRYQFLLIRRIVMWFLIAVIVATAFASELGAITTFAGLLTAGIAVALQNVILSIAGYFFLIGKYGVHIGDRVQIAGVTGDVVEVGLVRLQLMEVTGGPSPLPTGRVVAFSNAVVFQAGSGMFRQIPGTNFVWHEITLTLDPKSNYRQVEQRMMEAVNKVFGGYRERMEMQRRGVERSLNSTIAAFNPESRLHLTQTSLEVVIRYPVESGNAGEIDDRLTREILDAIERDPSLRLQVSGGPVIRMEEQKMEEQPVEHVKD
jgi:small-conductance mechanosensitive channel